MKSQLIARRKFIKTGLIFVPSYAVMAAGPIPQNPARGYVVAGGGGGASAFTFVQAASNRSDTNFASASFTNNITAGSLILGFFKNEGSGSVNAVTEHGSGGFTKLTKRDQASSDCHGQWAYKLVSAGGQKVVDVTWNATATFSKVVLLEFTYGGTATFVQEGVNGNDGSTALTTGTVTNSGSFRLNVAGYAGYSNVILSTLQIGGSAATAEETTQGADTQPATARENEIWTWFNTVNLSAASGSATLATSQTWVGCLASFAAN